MSHLFSLYACMLRVTSLKRAIPSSDTKKFCGKKTKEGRCFDCWL
jgi:hypothetical protein